MARRSLRDERKRQHRDPDSTGSDDDRGADSDALRDRCGNERPEDASEGREADNRPRVTASNPIWFRRTKSRAENTMLEKKLAQAVHIAMWRSRRSPKTILRPSTICAPTETPGDVFGTGSLVRIVASVAAEKKKEAESNSIAKGAWRTWMTAPANRGARGAGEGVCSSRACCSRRRAGRAPRWTGGRLVGYVEEDGEDTNEERRHVEIGELKQARQSRGRDRGEPWPRRRGRRR